MTTEHRGAPDLIYVRRERADAPPQLCIKKGETLMVWFLTPERVMALVADLANMAATQR